MLLRVCAQASIKAAAAGTLHGAKARLDLQRVAYVARAHAERCSETGAAKRRKRMSFDMWRRHAHADGPAPHSRGCPKTDWTQSRSSRPIHTKSLREFFDDTRGFVVAAIGE
jgi:hypothetical protein